MPRPSVPCARAAVPPLVALLATFWGPGALAAEPLAVKHGCLGCHASAAKLVGPAYQEVAAKYRDDPQAAARLAKSIRGGGSGRWGDVPMPPQPQVSEADAKRLAAWILGGAK